MARYRRKGSKPKGKVTTTKTKTTRTKRPTLTTTTTKTTRYGFAGGEGRKARAGAAQKAGKTAMRIARNFVKSTFSTTKKPGGHSYTRPKQGKR